MRHPWQVRIQVDNILDIINDALDSSMSSNFSSLQETPLIKDSHPIIIASAQPVVYEYTSQ
jgi:hypothetical protein